MKGHSRKENLAGGMDSRWAPDAHQASLVENFRQDDEGFGYINDRGWEAFVPGISNTLNHPDNDIYFLDDGHNFFEPCRMLHLYSRHQGHEQYYLWERGGALQYQDANTASPSTSAGIITLSENRYIPGPDHPGTQMAPYGRFALLLNGFDAPLKFFGRKVVRHFGWTRYPAAPMTLDIVPEYTRLNIDVTLSNNDTAVAFDLEEPLGLGLPATSAVNKYRYKISFISETGSESPLSEAAEITWTSLETNESLGSTANYKFGVVINDLPRGPEGTVARRIYRTRNMQDGLAGSGEIYYFLRQIDDNCTDVYVDVMPDSTLQVQKDLGDSVPINHSYQYAATFDGRMWLAGGQNQPTMLIYSEQGLPEQFARFNYFELGNRDGGHITALVPYYDQLLVFRERSIDVVNRLSSGDYTVNTLDQNIGTTATNTIRMVPGYGILFLSYDGLYALSGSLKGGASYTATRISAKLSKELKRLNQAALPRATAAYSPKEKEYWCHYPVDGESENTRGFVLHTGSGEFSLRNAEQSDTVMAFSHIITTPGGQFVMGTVPDADNYAPGVGLQTWSGAHHWGYTYDVEIYTGSINLIASEQPRGKSTWDSAWTSFGDSSIKKKVFSIEFEMVTQGDNPVELLYAKDYDYEWISAGEKKLQIAERIGKHTSAPVYGEGDYDRVVITDKNRYTDGQVTRIRWDVHVGAASHFKFRIRSSNIFHVVSYQLVHNPSNIKTLRS